MTTARKTPAAIIAEPGLQRLAIKRKPAGVAIANDQEHAAAIEQLIQWEQAPSPENASKLEALATAVEAYENATPGHRIGPPTTLRGILEVEMFKRRLRQKQLAELLEVSETRISELMKGKREMNMDFARKLYTRLSIPADVILSMAS